MILPRPQSPTVLEWNPQVGQPLPEPRIGDDRESFPEDVVRTVLRWLQSLKPQFDYDPTPTPQIVKIGNRIDGRKKTTNTKVRVMYQSGVSAAFGAIEFTAGTVEIILRDKRGAPIEATYHYLAARCPDGRCIVGPYLRHQQKRSILIAS